ncbi:metallophosphoesterase [Devosia ginsengisoli]|uniref:metallophosphoesterase n=1 Tax=Devosia ginsengisoli TaxID=400770 RepID=UPI0026F2C800|nr:metallophosphoesterase [Devosia ginsengisoli]MCR6673986.1 metallophosphoesterase [Devosia ginsengisoli]
MSDPVTFIHLTDLHVGNPAVQDDHLFSDTTTTLRRILADIKTLVPQPKFIVASGDLTNRGDQGSYENLKSIVAESGLDMPVLYALGNHDRRDGFYPAMLGRTDNVDAPYDHAEVIAGIHVIVLDSSVPDKVGGSFEPGQLDWLKAELENHAALPKLLVMHHAPALDTHNPTMEWNRCPTPIPRPCGRSSPARPCWASSRAISTTTAYPTGTASPPLSASASMPPPTCSGCMKACACSKVPPSPSAPCGPRVSPSPSRRRRPPRRELHSFTFSGMAEMLKKYEADTAVAAAE